MKLGSSSRIRILLVVLAITHATLARNEVSFHGLLRGGTSNKLGRQLSSDQCTAGEELVKCEYANRPCDGAGIDHCDIYCHDACKGSKIDESDVECVNAKSCEGTIFRNSTVNCDSTGDNNCRSAQFSASAVTCGRGGSSYQMSCSYAYFYPCSCCEKDGGGCWEGRQCYDSITGKADDFCASTFLGRTCKDWGNPVCKDVDVSTQAPIHEASECSIGEEVVTCDASGTLSSRNCANYPIKNCSVYCSTQGSCKGAKIDESDVECVNAKSCEGTIFRNSTVNCDSTGDNNCRSAQFSASAVTCGRGGSSYQMSCSYAYFYPCSCCEKDGGGCWEGRQCYDSITGEADDFCASTFLGRTCKDWGNPVCKDVDVSTQAPIHEASECSIGEEVVTCDASGTLSSRNCANYPIKNCSVYCSTQGSCKGAKIDESDVECVNAKSCEGTIFRNSTVNCDSTGDNNCRSAQFSASAVTCGRGGSSYQMSCSYAYFYPCSCRERNGGGGTVGRQCYDSITGKADDFCASTFLGRTCKDWGNPVCDDVKVATLAPVHKASECSIGEEVVTCDASGTLSSRNCANYPIKNCSVYCSTQGSCKGAKIDESDVECVREKSCEGAIFRNSTVNCHSTGDNNCRSAQFSASAVTCGRGGSSYQMSCSYAQFSDCSCCEGSGCPSSAPRCFDQITGKADDFCASTFLGRTCKDWGNPVCAPPKLQEILAEIGDVANWVDESTSEGDIPIPDDIDSEDGGIPDDDTPVSPPSPATLEETMLMIHEGDFGKWMPWVGIKDDINLSTFRGCGARIKFQPSQSGRDDTAANGLALTFCDSIGGWQSQDSLTVYSGVFGTWQPWVMCPQGSYINGAQVRYEDNGGTFTDDTALNGLKILCTDPSGKQSSVWKVVHKGLWGGWKPTVVADEGYYLSGASVRYEEHQEQFWFDDTAMNGLKMKFATFLF